MAPSNKKQKKTIKAVLRTGENERVEFKSSFDNEAIETVCAFANTHGGSLFIGVGDNGAAQGVAFGKESPQQWINQVKQTTSPSLLPDIIQHSVDGKTVVEIVVPEYPVKPVSYRGRYYHRIKNSNHSLTTAQVVDIHLKTFNASWDHYASERYSRDDLSIDKVKKFITQVNRVRPVPLTAGPVEVMRKYGLIRENRITNGCYLLFAAEDIPSTAIELGRFQSQTIIKDAARYKGDLLGAIDAVMGFIIKHSNRTITITGSPQHNEQWEYPMDALREIAVNAIVHRDYTAPGDTIVKVFDDRIEFFNPGGLPAGLTVPILLKGTYVSQPRNRLIAEMFKEAGIIEKFGSGIKRVVEACRRHGSKTPRFVEIAGGFLVTIFPARPSATQKSTQKPTQKSTQKQGLDADIIEFVKNNPTTTRAKMAMALQKSENTLKEHLADLKARGVLARKGSDRSGYWVVRQSKTNRKNGKSKNVNSKL